MVSDAVAIARARARGTASRSERSIVGSFLGIISVGLVITFLVVGGGLALPFIGIPWFVWAGLLLVLILFITR